MTTPPSTLAVLFADICDSSRLYETLGDRQALDYISRTLALIDLAARRHKGQVLKTIGDELMCAFPDSQSAADAAMQMQHDVARGVVQIGRSMHIRIGFQHGQVIKDRQDVFGDAVNIAARLVALARPGQILTTRETAAQLPQDTRWQQRPIEAIHVKGRQEAVAICEIVWAQEEDITVFIRSNAPRSVTSDSLLKLKIGERELAVDAQSGRISFGRDADCDVLLHDRMASREHARIEWRGEGCFLSDLSSNGTWIAFEGQPEIRLRRQQVLLHGQGLIGFGRSPLQVIDNPPGKQDEVVRFDLCQAEPLEPLVN